MVKAVITASLVCGLATVTVAAYGIFLFAGREREREREGSERKERERGWMLIKRMDQSAVQNASITHSFNHCERVDAKSNNARIMPHFCYADSTEN